MLCSHADWDVPRGESIVTEQASSRRSRGGDAGTVRRRVLLLSALCPAAVAYTGAIPARSGSQDSCLRALLDHSQTAGRCRHGAKYPWVYNVASFSTEQETVPFHAA